MLDTDAQEKKGEPSQKEEETTSTEKKEDQKDKKEEQKGKKEEKEEESKVEAEEPEQPPTTRQSAISRLLSRLWEGNWKTILIFTIDRDSKVGIFLRLFGVLLAFVSSFTISYQVIHTSPSCMNNYVRIYM